MLMKELEELLNLDTLSLSKALLGWQLRLISLEGIYEGIIVETEAYLQDDPACHAYRKKTTRNAPMFGSEGTIYVYQIYGMHYCVNISGNKEGVGEAVLIRALEPTKGIDLMKKRRNTDSIRNLCSGPAKLVQAFGINKEMNFWNVKTHDLTLIATSATIDEEQIVTTTRIGITQGVELPYRFYLKNSRYISKK